MIYVTRSIFIQDLIDIVLQWALESDYIGCVP